jgi:hypothetical protein
MSEMAEGEHLGVIYPANPGEVAVFAARELAEALSVMLEVEVGIRAESAPVSTSGGPYLRVGRGGRSGARPADMATARLAGDGFALRREAIPSLVGGGGGTLVIEGGTERALLHGACYLLERLGADFPVIGPARFPRIDERKLDTVGQATVQPAFARRALVSDIMTWHYTYPDRLALHLEHDRTFIPWMSARGLNAFSYIRHARDSLMKIDELAPLYRQRGVVPEYGGHVLQLLLARDRFELHPEFFPANADGLRNRDGNLCVSNADALAEVCAGAVRYVQENPEGELLHIWGADVWQGAWCQCGGCAGLSPQRQYMKIVNAIAEALALEGIKCPVAYLAYHDTLRPDCGLCPMPNVHFEWAPRERCYSHGIDDSACAVNRDYYDSLRRYIELFDGRGHVFEYYADAILFGGLGVATPSVIGRDLRAYRSLGLDSISCLTFGAYSTLAYPVNLEAFALGTRSPDFDADTVIADTAARLHPQCDHRMAAAYEAIAEASAAILENGGDVMRPKAGRGVAAVDAKRREVTIAQLNRACSAAESLAASSGDRLAAGESWIWRYNLKAVKGILAYLIALEETGAGRIGDGEAALAQINDAIGAIHEIQAELRGTWGSYDIEWIRQIWIEAMRRRLDEAQL